MSLYGDVLNQQERHMGKEITGHEILEALRSFDEPVVQRVLDRGSLEMASASKAQELQLWIKRILDANGIESAWVSDRSNMGDFIGGTPEEREAERRKIVEKLGHDFQLHEKIVDVAARLKLEDYKGLPN